MKPIPKYALSVVLLVLVSSLVMDLGCSDALAVEFGFHQINFLGASYDSGADATTFSYRAIAAANWGFDFWILALNPECFGAGDIIDASEPFEYVVDDQIIPPILGIKFTQPYGPGESRDVSFRLRGDLSTGLVRVVLREAGCTYHEREIEGPECDGEPCPPPQCDVTPDRDSVCVGSDVTFTVNITGTPPFTYCWQKEPYTDPCISTTNQLTIFGVTLADAGTYRVIVTDECGADTCYVVLKVYQRPPEGEGKSPGYWGNQLAIYLGYKNGKLKEPDVASYAAQYGYTAQQAYDIMLTGEGGTAVEKLHRQLVAAKLSTAAGYLSGMDELLEWGQYMVAHPEEFTEQEILDAKNFFESLHD